MTCGRPGGEGVSEEEDQAGRPIHAEEPAGLQRQEVQLQEQPAQQSGSPAQSVHAARAEDGGPAEPGQARSVRPLRRVPSLHGRTAAQGEGQVSQRCF